jgi:hypothetical protein
LSEKQNVSAETEVENDNVDIAGTELVMAMTLKVH